MSAELGAERLQEAVDAVNQLRQADNPLGLADALKRLGYIERHLKMYEAAGLHYDEAAAIYRQQGAILSLAHAVRHLGDVYRDAGRMQLARPCYDEALDLYRKTEGAPALDLANAIRSAALLAGAMGDKGQASRFWQEARSLYLSANIQEGVAECNRWLSKLQNCDEAELS
jgi:tetratricopeptide (TPR) repeat protein